MICIGKHQFKAERGVVQGAVLSPMLFNVYLEEALNTSAKLAEMRRRGDLLAFADDMLILTNSKPELEEAIRELEGLGYMWSLKLNKDKSQVLTTDPAKDIAGVPCMTHVKYLGVPIHVNPKQMHEMCMATIKRNLNHLRWKLKNCDVAIKETLTCVLARSILIYVGTPLVAAQRWKQSDIERVEVQLYRGTHGLTNLVSNKAVMNVACAIRPTWDIVKTLAHRALLQARHQRELRYATVANPPRGHSNDIEGNTDQNLNTGIPDI